MLRSQCFLVWCGITVSAFGEPLPVETGSRIPHELSIAPFTPPPPPKEAPVMRVESQVVRPSAAGRTLTLLRGEASWLPDLPEPLLKKPVARAVETESQPYERNGDVVEREPVRQLMLGATVYDGSISYVHWHDPETGRFHQALCGFDVGLFEGVGEFLHEGKLHSLFLMHSRVDTETLRRLSHGWVMPEFPALAEDQVLSLDEKGAEPADLSPVIKLRDVLKVDRTKLEKLAVEREIYRERYDAWHAANPEQARDHVIWFKPHRGSRYLRGAENISVEGDGR